MRTLIAKLYFFRARFIILGSLWTTASAARPTEVRLIVAEDGFSARESIQCLHPSPKMVKLSENTFCASSSILKVGCVANRLRQVAYLLAVVNPVLEECNFLIVDLV